MLLKSKNGVENGLSAETASLEKKTISLPGKVMVLIFFWDYLDIIYVNYSEKKATITAPSAAGPVLKLLEFRPDEKKSLINRESNHGNAFRVWAISPR